MCRPQYNLLKANMDNFNSELERLVFSLLDVSNNSSKTLNPAQKYEGLHDAINRALLQAGASIKYSKPASRRPPTPWWDEDCSSIYKIKTDAFLCYKDHPTLENLEKYNIICKTVNKRLRKIKKFKYRSFCESLNKDTDIKKIWTTVAAFRNRISVDKCNLEFSAERIEDARDAFRSAVSSKNQSEITLTFLRENLSLDNISHNHVNSEDNNCFSSLNEEISQTEFQYVFRKNI